MNKRIGSDPRGWAAALAVGVLFIGLSAGDPGLPGLGLDEVYDTGCYAMELVAGLPPTQAAWSVEAFGRTWPLKMNHPYETGFFQTYWTALFFLLGGVSVETLRLSVVFLSAGTLLFTYGFCRLWFTGRAALGAVLLLAVNPAFVLWSRMGHQVAEVFVIFFGMACLFFFSLWHLRRRVWALPAAFFFWGLSITATVKGAAILLAFPAAFTLCVPRRLWPGARLLAAGAAAAAAGAAPVIVYELVQGFPTAARLLGSLAAPTLLGVDNAAFLGNFAARIGQVGALLSGQGLAGPSGGPDRLDPLMAAAVAGSFVFLAARGFRRGGDRMSRLLIVLPAALLAATCFTPMGLHPPHVLVIWPLTCVAVALAADGLARSATALGGRAGRLASGVVAAVLVTLVALDLRVVAGFHRTLARTGGDGIWSDSIYALARHLEETGGPQPVCLTWGLSRNVYFLTRGRVDPLDGHNFRFGVDGELRNLYRESLRDPAVRYVLLAEDVRPNQGMVMGYYEAIRREARSAGLRLAVEREFADRAGRPVFQVARTERL